MPGNTYLGTIVPPGQDPTRRARDRRIPKDALPELQQKETSNLDRLPDDQAEVKKNPRLAEEVFRGYDRRDLARLAKSLESKGEDTATQGLTLGLEYRDGRWGDVGARKDKDLPLLTDRLEALRAAGRAASRRDAPGTGCPPGRSPARYPDLPSPDPGAGRPILYRPGRLRSRPEHLFRRHPWHPGCRGRARPGRHSRHHRARGPDAHRRHRAAGWRTLTIPASGETPAWSLSFDGSGRYAGERVLASGLAEHIVCDGKELLHLYPELGPRCATCGDALSPGRARAASSPGRCRPRRTWPTDSTSSASTSAGRRPVPHGLEADRPAVVVHLVFAADGRLAERRLVEVPKNRTLHSARPTKTAS